MADVQDPATAAPEPSMEEILASIRKIIADENTPSEHKTPEADVVELTQMVQDDGTVVDLSEEPPAPEPVKPAAVTPPPAPAPVVEPVVETKTLVSESTAKSAALSLSSLADSVAIDRLSSEPASGSMYVGNGARTLEDMAIELMRPLLKQWLEQNLPATVDRLVQKEIERIARRAKD